MTEESDFRRFLPEDLERARLVGRIWASTGSAGAGGGPLVVTIGTDDVFAVDGHTPFCSGILASDDLDNLITSAFASPPVCSLRELFANTLNGRGDAPYLLSPIDLQAIKAAGVTFAVSLIERLVEEKAGGNPARASEIRSEFEAVLGTDLSKIRPGSDAATKLESHLRERGMWSQYCEVGIGPYAEIFTKSQPLSSVGFGAEVGLHPDSRWNNPEPEVVLVVTPDQRIVGATLGNDVNLRDIEGRSALLLGRAKDNNASCALGPFIRLLDHNFTLDNVRKLTVSLTVQDAAGFRLEGSSNMAQISRDIVDLVEQCSGRAHQFPDGFVLMTGTLFAPTHDRGTPGMGFSHRLGDTVEISARELGCLRNHVTTSDVAPPWSMGIGALVENLSSRGLL